MNCSLVSRLALLGLIAISTCLHGCRPQSISQRPGSTKTMLRFREEISQLIDSFPDGFDSRMGLIYIVKGRQVCHCSPIENIHSNDYLRVTKNFYPVAIFGKNRAI